MCSMLKVTTKVSLQSSFTDSRWNLRSLSSPDKGRQFFLCLESCAWKHHCQQFTPWILSPLAPLLPMKKWTHSVLPNTHKWKFELPMQTPNWISFEDIVTSNGLSVCPHCRFFPSSRPHTLQQHHHSSPSVESLFFALVVVAMVSLLLMPC